MKPSRRSSPLVLGLFLVGLPLGAASYIPMADVDLVRQAPIVVRAEVTDRTARLTRDGREDRPFTVVTLRSVELYKGSIGETFTVLVPGGAVGDLKWWVPGAPEFEPGLEVVLMLHPLPGRAGEYGLSEFGLSKFDLVVDAQGRAFAVRPQFGPDADLRVSKREFPLALKATGSADYPARDGESFLGALRELVTGLPLREIAYAFPRGEFRRAGMREKHGNIGGVEPGNCGTQPCLFRWRTGVAGGSPDAVVHITGTQTMLTGTHAGCGTDQNCLVADAINQWHGIANTDIDVSGPLGTGTVEALMDQDMPHQGTAWNGPYNCSGGGVVGLGGPSSQGGVRIFKGISPYYDCGGGTISMRRFICPYDAAGFQGVFLHELGHVLGAAHPDQTQSIHSTTNSAQWSASVMFSGGHAVAVTTPQTDDILGFQFLYGTATPGPAPAANFTSTQSAPNTLSFTDTSTNGATGWVWFLGEAASPTNYSRVQNPTHTYAGPGTYTVDLYAGNFNGGSRVTKQVSVTGGGGGACVPNANTLCLTNDRFRVTASFRTAAGQSGQGVATELTADSGYFTFFNPANIEIVIKTLNACFSNFYWAFIAGLTNVEVTVTVTDTQRNITKVYPNAQGTAFAPVQDTSAFATCP